MNHDPKLAAAEERLAAAKAEVDRWESFIRTYQELENGVHEPKPVHGRMYSRVRQINGHKIEKRARSSKLTHTEKVAGLIISEYGRPVPSVEMMRELKARGVEIGGKEPASTLAARLSRAVSIEFQKGLGWALRSIPDKQEEPDKVVPHG